MSFVILSLLIACNCTAPVLGKAAKICEDTPNGQVSECEVGIPSRRLNAVTRKIGGQGRKKWCWATSMAFILQYHGMNVTKEMVVQRVYGSKIDKGAPNNLLVQKINGNWTDLNGARFNVKALWYRMVKFYQYRHKKTALHKVKTGMYKTTKTLRNELEHDNPVYFSAYRSFHDAHAMVITSVRYFCRKNTNKCSLTSVLVRDPAGNRKHELTLEDWRTRSGYVTVRVKKL